MDAENEPQKEREQNKTLGCESVSYAGLAIWIVCFIDQPPQPDPHHTRTCRNSWTSSISDARNRSLMRQTPSCSRWSSSVSSRRIQASTGSKKKKNTLHHPPALLCLSLSLSLSSPLASPSLPLQASIIFTAPLATAWDTPCTCSCKPTSVKSQPACAKRRVKRRAAARTQGLWVKTTGVQPV